MTQISGVERVRRDPRRSQVDEVRERSVRRRGRVEAVEGCDCRVKVEDSLSNIWVVGPVAEGWGAVAHRCRELGGDRKGKGRGAYSRTKGLLPVVSTRENERSPNFQTARGRSRSVQLSAKQLHASSHRGARGLTTDVLPSAFGRAWRNPGHAWKFKSRIYGGLRGEQCPCSVSQRLGGLVRPPPRGGCHLKGMTAQPRILAAAVRIES